MEGVDAVVDKDAVSALIENGSRPTSWSSPLT
jgi:hypothetical protein